VGLKLNETHQLLAYADDETLLRDNVDTIKKNANILFDASKYISLEVSIEKAKYIVCYHDATASSFVAKVRGEVFAHFYLSP
jgi:hypothetical protein